MQGREGLDWWPWPVGGVLRRDRLGGERRDHDATPHDQVHAAHARVSPQHGRAALISARGLALARAGRPILSGVDIDISPGEIVTVIGPNGAGKTMLVRALLGLERIDRGAVHRRESLIVGYAPQRFDIDRANPLTVARFAALGRRTTRPEIERVLLFRDWLRENAADRELYERTKRELARREWKYMQNYADAKTAVVEEILARAQEAAGHRRHEDR